LPRPPGRRALLAAPALVGFAANSLLCRTALRPDLMDPVTFTTVRLISGAATLWLLGLRAAAPAAVPRAGRWLSALALFAYAITFSAAYVEIGAGVGALLLFGAVQATMLGWALRTGERPAAREWAGLALALSGLVALVLPGLTAPAPRGAVLMVTAGIAWAVYTLRGRGTADPLLTTAGNFVLSVPMTLAASIVAFPAAHAQARGLALAAASGAVASGLGYTLWYASLPALGATRAAIVQLTVPVLTAAAAVVLLGEAVTPRLVACAAAILSGVALAMAGRR
jgi:drug/metabolite transporter (DMT)-like permease